MEKIRQERAIVFLELKTSSRRSFLLTKKTQKTPEASFSRRYTISSKEPKAREDLSS